MAPTLRTSWYALSFVLCACGGETPPAVAPPVAEPAASAPAAEPMPMVSAMSAPAPMEAPTPEAPAPVAKYTGMQTPESVLYDDARDRYLVSNINGKPTDVDGNGYISVLAPDGAVTTAKWIEGGRNKVKLDAPKGMAIVKGVLYVADITNVRMFDVVTGAPKGSIKIAGTTFLNDVAAAPDGKVYVSDSGLKGGEKGLEGTGTDAVYVIDNGKAKPFAKGKELGQPNGVLVTDKGVLVVTFGTNELYRLDAKGMKVDMTKLPKGGLDGIVMLPGGDLLVSSWEAAAVYRGKLGGEFTPVLTGQKSPADIGYDTKRSRVLIPHFMEDTVETYTLK